MTVGNTARMQLNMAQAQTKYGDQLDSLYANYSVGNKTSKLGLDKTNATKTLNELLKSSALKGKDENFRSQFSSLYKNIFGIKDDDAEDDSSVASSQSIKVASSNAGNSTEAIRKFANGLDYGQADKLDEDTYKAYAKSFVDSYNAMIDKVGKAENQSVLQKGVLLVNTAKVHTSALKRAGITLGSDNKLTLSDDLSKVRATDVKTLFGSKGFSDKVLQKASQINSLTGGYGGFSANAAVIDKGSDKANDINNYVDNSGTMKELTAKVKELATAVKSYAQGLGTEDKTFVATDYTKTASEFVENYNKMMEEMGKSDKSTVRSAVSDMKSTANAYKYALQKSGIKVDKDGKLGLMDQINLKNLNDNDIKYTFAKGGFIDKVLEKTNQVNALASSASAMGYNANSGTNYAYTSGALFSVYA